MARRIEVEPLPTTPIEEQKIELVERKGLGHPDSIADGVSESVDRALCRLYLDNFGKILHHNTDETQVVGGGSEPKFGGGRVTAPIYILLVGRATTEVNGEKLPYRQVAIDAAKEYISSVCSHLDVEKQVETKIRNHRRNAPRRRALQRVNHQQQLHQMPVHRTARGLHHEHIRAAHVLLNLHVRLAVGKARYLRLSPLHAQKLAYLIGQLRVGRAAKNLKLLIHPRTRLPLQLLVRHRWTLLFNLLSLVSRRD